MGVEVCSLQNKNIHFMVGGDQPPGDDVGVAHAAFTNPPCKAVSVISGRLEQIMKDELYTDPPPIFTQNQTAPHTQDFHPGDRRSCPRQASFLEPNRVAFVPKTSQISSSTSPRYVCTSHLRTKLEKTKTLVGTPVLYEKSLPV